MTFDAVLIAGPTASGKSAAALALAEAIGGVIINADSMQVYRQAPILTERGGAEQYRRERRAQLVGKRGDKMVLGPRRGFSGFLGRAQSFLRGLPLRDVPDEAHEKLPLGARQGTDAQFHGESSAVPPQRG